MPIAHTHRKPDSPLQVEAQGALREALTTIGRHTVSSVAAQAGISVATLYAHTTEPAPHKSRKYPLRVPASRLRSVARAMEAQLDAISAAVERLDAAADQMETAGERQEVAAT